MICLPKNELKIIIRETYLRSLQESKDYNKEIVSLILRLKDTLLKKNFVCQTQYVAPDLNQRHRDYGYCSVKVDTTIGRGKSMKPKSICNIVNRVCEKLGVNKYFILSNQGFDGKYCDCGFKLKPRYVEKYMSI